ncbi:helix-turn-helix domain-containing protein [Candidatus Micrarchaeota archaeon]|nr:helix-turn-helix domain-containing protein [Candidatus Micrarchaeota archaeon]
MKSSEQPKNACAVREFGKRGSGRPRRLDCTSVAEMRQLYLGYPFYSVRELAEIFEVSRMTVWRTVKGC